VRSNAATYLSLAARTYSPTAIEPGDTVVVIADEVKLKVGRDVRAVLPRGTHLLVTEIEGNWIGGQASVGGQKIMGWFQKSEAERLASDVEEPPASAAEEPLASAVEEPLALTAEEPPASTAEEPLASTAEEPLASAVAEPLEPPLADTTDVAAGDPEDLTVRISIVHNDAGLETIDRSGDIGRLILTGDGVTNAGLKQLEGLNVRALSIEGTQITNTGLQYLASLTNLKSLRLWSYQLTNASLQHVKNLAGLETLDIDGTAIQGSGLKRLEDLPKLRTLVLGPAVRDADLEYLKDLASLQEVDLRACRHISDAGLAHIGALAKLRAVWLPQQITEEGRNKLRQKLPKCECRWYTARAQD
jgi:hypothetical protein